MQDQATGRKIQAALYRVLDEYGALVTAVSLRVIRRFARQALTVDRATMSAIGLAIPFSSMIPAALVLHEQSAARLYIASEVIDATWDVRARGDLLAAARLLPEAIMDMVSAAFLPRVGISLTEVAGPMPGPCVVILCIQNGEVTLCCAWLRRYRAA